MGTKVGFRLSEARNMVSGISGSREDYGPTPLLWRLEKRISRVGKVAGFLYLLGILVLIRVLTEGGCVIKR